MSYSITCDRVDALWRVAVWQGRELVDLYLDRMDKPDCTEAVMHGKVTRIFAKQKAAFVDVGFDEAVYVEQAQDIRTGDGVTVRITAAARQGKAYAGVLTKADVAAPPCVWQRAIKAIKDGKIISLRFAHKKDYEECQVWLEETNPKLIDALHPVTRDSVHPELDEHIAMLSSPQVVLGDRKSNIVIEITEALVAIDVNGEMDGNALAINLLAVKEAARQIRLRNLSGIILIDLLKMKERPDQAKVMNALKNAVAGDAADVRVFGVTKLGLIEMTRMRRGLGLADVL